MWGARAERHVIRLNRSLGIATFPIRSFMQVYTIKASPQLSLAHNLWAELRWRASSKESLVDLLLSYDIPAAVNAIATAADLHSLPPPPSCCGS